jgi:hypothetical protein
MRFFRRLAKAAIVKDTADCQKFGQSLSEDIEGGEGLGGAIVMAVFDFLGHALDGVAGVIRVVFDLGDELTDLTEKLGQALGSKQQQDGYRDEEQFEETDAKHA